VIVHCGDHRRGARPLQGTGPLACAKVPRCYPPKDGPGETGEPCKLPQWLQWHFYAFLSLKISVWWCDVLRSILRIGNDAGASLSMIASTDVDCLAEDIRGKSSRMKSTHAQSTDTQTAATSHHHTGMVCTIYMQCILISLQDQGLQWHI